jgi:hypothetical protein
MGNWTLLGEVHVWVAKKRIETALKEIIGRMLIRK